MLPPATPSNVTAAILNVGDELLAGDVVNTNAAFLADRARALGITVVETRVVRDRIPEIVAALASISPAVEVCWVSGGLGPTSDDLTSQAIADAARLPLVRDPAALARLEDKFRTWGRPMAALNAKQADFPEGAAILANPVGTAEGFALQLGRCRCYVMPGVPRELITMMTGEVEPELQARYGRAPIPRRIYRTLGRGESSLAESLVPALARISARSPALAALFVHYRATTPQVQIILEATPGPSGEQASADDLRALDPELYEAIGPALYGIGSAGLGARVLAALTRAGLRLCTAESCTGGGIGQSLAAVPNASAAFLGGIIAYDNAVKISLLGVSADLLDEHGAVSEPVARAMARGARAATGADLSVAVTGIAGPTGGSAAKPVGTVHLAVSDAHGEVHLELHLRGDRGTVQRSTEQWALKLVWDRLVGRGLAAITEQDS